jgi:hypothetical protein
MMEQYLAQQVSYRQEHPSFSIALRTMARHHLERVPFIEFELLWGS